MALYARMKKPGLRDFGGLSSTLLVLYVHKWALIPFHYMEWIYLKSGFWVYDRSSFDHVRVLNYEFFSRKSEAYKSIFILTKYFQTKRIIHFNFWRIPSNEHLQLNFFLNEIWFIMRWKPKMRLNNWGNNNSYFSLKDTRR